MSFFQLFILGKQKLHSTPTVPACSQRMRRPVAPCFFACAAAWQKQNSKNIQLLRRLVLLRVHGIYTLPETNSKSTLKIDGWKTILSFWGKTVSSGIRDPCNGL